MLALAHLPLVQTADSKSSGSGVGSLVLIALVVVALGFMVLSGRRRAKRAQEQQEELAIGSTVVTRAGLIATLVDRTDDEVVLEIAPGVRARFVPQAVGRVLSSGDEVQEPDGPAEDGHADGSDDTGDGRLAD